ncbi:MAG: hypothetical protein KH037_04945 [Burkholderiales bacterium]|uniref:hypothetical protein n=1 Tax=uncultured Turicimonas sp. TaxID=1918607 RepID=UPI001ED63944|nr:hypothetical protein [uncultured Turicimonas sp.]MBS4846018.1 hypothetical protein [Burkholderiales bacterium]
MAIRLQQLQLENQRLFEKAARQSIEIQKQNDEIVSLREKIDIAVQDINANIKKIDSIIESAKKTS